MARTIVCTKCGRSRPHGARGQCDSCYTNGRAKWRKQHPLRSRMAKRLRALALRVEGVR